jgi:hypothetical protein
MLKLLIWIFLAVAIVLGATHALIYNSSAELLAGAAICAICGLFCFLVHVFSSRKGGVFEEDCDYRCEYEASGSERTRRKEIRRKYGNSAADFESYP